MLAIILSLVTTVPAHASHHGEQITSASDSVGWSHGGFEAPEHFHLETDGFRADVDIHRGPSLGQTLFLRETVEDTTTGKREVRDSQGDETFRLRPGAETRQTLICTIDA
jgi:hypothetical protein